MSAKVTNMPPRPMTRAEVEAWPDTDEPCPIAPRWIDGRNAPKTWREVRQMYLTWIEHAEAYKGEKAASKPEPSPYRWG